MDDEESLKRMVQTIRNYQEDSMNKLSYMQKTLSDASLKHKELLLSAGFERYLNNLYNCVEYNNSVLQDILQSSELQVDDDSNQDQKRTLALDFQRLNSCLMQIVREWSADGQAERDKCFSPIIEEL